MPCAWMTAGKNQPIAHQDGGQAIYLYATDSPAVDATGRIEDMAIYAGQSVGQIHAICSAGQRIEAIMQEARNCLQGLAGQAG